MDLKTAQISTIALIALILLQSGHPGPLVPLTQLPVPFAPGHFAYGIASWYGQKDVGEGAVTAGGERFDPQAMVCASWDYPLNTRLRITNLNNGRQVVCRVNDRGPARGLGRAVDLTPSAFSQIADPDVGTVPVAVEPWTEGSPFRWAWRSSKT